MSAAVTPLLRSNVVCIQRFAVILQIQQVERDDLEERLSSILQLGSATALKRFAIEREQVSCTVILLNTLCKRTKLHMYSTECKVKKGDAIYMSCVHALSYDELI
jgi:hypothetical protein